MLSLYALSFYFVNVSGLHNVYYMVMSISEKPKEIFNNKYVLSVFVLLIPAIPIANIPSLVLLGKSTAGDVVLQAGISLLFFIFSFICVHMGVKRYASASS